MKVDYSIRPAKNVERKMLCEAFGRLSAFHTLSKYRYVGFGSATFNDFSLVHRQLGIGDMVSIESDTSNKSRYEFNRPFHCITIQFGESVDVLPSLDWKKPSIVWLDYESKLIKDILSDVDCVTANIVSGGVFALSFNTRSPLATEDPIADLQERVGLEHMPEGLTVSDFRGWLSANVDCRVVVNKIREALRARNADSDEADRLAFQQIFNFRYADGVKMATFGGVFFKHSEKEKLDRCGFPDLDFVRTDESAYLIETPILTFRELRYLNRGLPTDFAALKKDKVISKEDIDKYRKVYRYFPAFAETEL